MRLIRNKMDVAECYLDELVHQNLVQFKPTKTERRLLAEVQNVVFKILSGTYACLRLWRKNSSVLFTCSMNLSMNPKQT